MVPRLHARPTPGCAGATATRRREFPYDRPRRREPAPRPARPRVRAARHRASSTRTATGTSPSTTPRRARTTLHPAVGPQRRTGRGRPLHVLPTLWFRNTWSWGRRRPQAGASSARDGVARRRAPASSAGWCWSATAGRRPLFCDNETNAERLWGTAGRRRTRRTASATTSCNGADTVNPDRTGTKAAALVPARRWRRARRPRSGCASPPIAGDLDADFDRGRCPSASARPTRSTPRCSGRRSTDEAAMIARQALAGMLWSKQFYHYDVERWLDGDPAGPPPPAGRDRGRNHEWRHLNNADVDLDARHVGVPVVRRVGPGVPLRRARPRRRRSSPRTSCCSCAASGTCTPTASCPPTSGPSATSTRRCTPGPRCGSSRSTAARDLDFLERIFHKLLLNFTWWVNRKDADGNNVFEGGFLGLDNIGPIDRSAPLPVGGHLEQSDGTAWMALFCLNMLEIALVLGRAPTPPTRTWPPSSSSTSPTSPRPSTTRAVGRRGRLLLRRVACGSATSGVPAAGPLDGRPAAAVRGHDRSSRRTLAALPDVRRPAATGSSSTGPQLAAARRPSPRARRHRGPPARHRRARAPGAHARRACSTRTSSSRPTASARSRRATATSPFVLRARRHGGDASTTSRPSRTTGLFGGNSNWRGPGVVPRQPPVIEALRRYAPLLRRRLHGRVPDRLGHAAGRSSEVADDARRPARVAVPRRRRRPPAGPRCLREASSTDPAWHDRLLFHEYFHGDTGAGLGASHQTGWTGLVADLLLRRQA